MNRMRSLVLVVVMAGGLLAAGAQSRAEASPGPRTWAFGNLGHIDVDQSKAGTKVHVTLNNGCYVVQKLKPLEYTFNAKLKKADLLTNTPCGTIALHWEGYSDLRTMDTLWLIYRRAVATGTIAGQAFNSYTHPQAADGTLIGLNTQ